MGDEQRTGHAAEVTRAEWRWLLAALVLSLALLGGAAAKTWQVGQQSNRLYHALYHAREDLDGLRQSVGVPPATAAPGREASAQ